MNKLQNLLKGNWIECGGGSRPGSSLLKFNSTGTDIVELHFRYVFDWESREWQYLVFYIPAEDFYDSLRQLEQDGYSLLEANGRGQKLVWEWRILDDRVQFRFKGKNLRSVDGPLAYDSPVYEDLLL